MRNFYMLDTSILDNEAGLISFNSSIEAPFRPQLTLRKEGAYIVLSVSHGPIEVALRPRAEELRRVLSHLHVVKDLQTTRQAGTGEAYIALGLQSDGKLLMRPTLVSDATGHMCFNLTLTDEARKVLFEWLDVVAENE